ncbi:stage III sporulation protein E [Bacillus coahuilensis p1.1.43]|uniref:Stage III sporulation protein E n=1 Tax=Bacillus coahuilensis p1.1.43 TaxID=1150625 RepID=A0A147K6R7_9BACI|nr:stage III sporulation protein E [Bacillus coahuilensis p1.1.43]
MSWIKKLFNLPTEQQDTIHEREDRETMPARETKEIETRMTYQYPKGQFKFPLIPDGKDEKAIRSYDESVELKVEEDRSDRSREVEDVYSNPNRSSLPTPKNKRPFKPTEIPSPIYGFQKRQQVNLIQADFDKVLSFPTLVHNKKELVEHHTKEQDFQELPVSEIPEETSFVESRLELKEDVPIKETELVKAEEEKEVPPWITEEEEREELQKVPALAITDETSSVEENEHREKEESAATIEEPSTNTRREQRRKSRLPFNVIMLKQDKEKVAKAQTQNSKEHKDVTQTFTSQEQTALPESKIIESSSTNVSQTRVAEKVDSGYKAPSLSLLTPPVQRMEEEEWLDAQQDLLNETLANFNVKAHVINVTQGPSVTRFEVQPEPGVKVNKITNLSDDIKLSLAAKDIRMEAPIPGKNAIGIEIPNPKSRPVFLSEIIQHPRFQEAESPLSVALGLDISGQPVVTDLNKMPHGLIAGATGSGKSVCINSIIVSLLYKSSPHDVKLLMIDPKMVELAPYNHIPHLVSPVITDVKAATASLKWAVEEMERRYELFAHAGVRDISRYNKIAMDNKQYNQKLPFIVIIIDELADLMMMSPQDVEESICRIAQKARACGIHLLIATQRPSVDVITGLIKANVPTRVAFSVSSQIDSRTIIDMSGAERLLGKGDMLFLENGSSKSVRLQGTFVTDEEIDQIVDHVRKQGEPNYIFNQEQLIRKEATIEEEDELFYEACEFVVGQGAASASSLQRRFRIGYNRAARLVEMMEEQGMISGAKGSKPRDVLISEEQLEKLYE